MLPPRITQLVTPRDIRLFTTGAARPYAPLAIGDTIEAVAALTALLAKVRDAEGPYQALLEEKSELVPVLDLLNHDVQWNSVLSKFSITSDREVDLAIVTKSTDAWRGIFIELEHPGKTLFIDTPHPDFHSHTRQAIAQVQHWKTAIDKDPPAVRERFRPLMHMGGRWDTNPIDFRYVLIIGRSPAGGYSEAQANLVHRLAEESQIRLMTWDSVVRHATASKRWRLNVLAHNKGGFRVKRAQGGTNLFGHFYQDQIHVDDEAEKWFKAQGYDIDSWRAGKLLTLNQKLPLGDDPIKAIVAATKNS